MITILRSQVATLAVLALALLAQLPHAAEVFMQAGNVHGWWGYLHGASYAIALELAVLLFVVQGRKMESYGFAFVSVLVNLAYYAERVELFSLQALPAWLIAFALPVAIALYSHSLAGEEDAQVEWGAVWLQVRKWTSLQADELGQVAEVEYPQVALQAEEFPVQEGTDPKTLAQNLRASGRKIAEIAQAVGKSESWVSRNTEAVIA